LISNGDFMSHAIYWDFVTGIPSSGTGTNIVADHNIAWDVEIGFNINGNTYCDLHNNSVFAYGKSASANGALSNENITNNIFAPRGLSELHINRSNVSDNISGTYPGIFSDPAVGDFRLQSDWRSQITTGSDPIVQSKSDYLSEPGATTVSASPWWWSGTGSAVSYVQPAPSNLIVIQNSDQSVNLNWTDNDSSNSLNYIERAIRRDDGRRGFKVIAELPAHSTHWSDHSLSDAQIAKAYYRVRTVQAPASNVSAPVDASRIGLHGASNIKTSHLEGQSFIVITLTRSGDIQSPLIVRYRLGGSAREGVDYPALPHIAVFQAGHESTDVIVNFVKGKPRKSVTLNVTEY
jgi:hypothetical protein